MRLIILGATGTIGAAIAAAAIDGGWDVGVLGRSPTKLSKLNGAVGAWTFEAEDLTSLERAFSQVRESGFSADAAINAFGITHRSPFLDHSAEAWDSVVAVNLRATWRAMQLEAELIISRGAGSIVNIGSVASIRANGWGEAAYIASKHGLVGLTKAAAVELGPMGVRVNLVCPSVVESDFTQGLSFGSADLSQIGQKHPLRRLVTPAEVAQTALWLAGDTSGGISGSLVTVDAGLTAK